MIATFEQFLTVINFDLLEDAESKSAYIWILGEFGAQIDLAPYVLERMIKINKEEPNVDVTKALLLSLVKLFFIRAPEVKEMLGDFFKFVLKECKDVDLIHNQAAFYYKLLQTNPLLAQQVILGEQ